MLGKNSADYILKYFSLFFLENRLLTFHANCPQSVANQICLESGKGQANNLNTLLGSEVDYRSVQTVGSSW